MARARRIACLRPRVEGAREEEIFQATLTVLVEVGYDRLTMDRVALKAHASKATLYRRWSGKAQLVTDAISSAKDHNTLPDTGALHSDLKMYYCGGELTDPQSIKVLGAVLTALACDPEFAAAFRASVINPTMENTMLLLERAQARGEISPEADLALVGPAIGGIIMHRVLIVGEPPTPTIIGKVIDQIIMPALTTAPLTLSGAPTEKGIS